VSETVDELIARMVALLALLEVDGDPARFFLGTYLRITRAVGTAVADGLFEDPSWVARWDVDFAGFYLDALEAYRRDPATAPAPWREAFGAKATLPPQGHVLLGVNAHINFDLPQSLVRVIPTRTSPSPRCWPGGNATTSGSTACSPPGSRPRTSSCRTRATSAPGWTAGWHP
jgi:Family of unknown function (DUF5995)